MTGRFGRCGAGLGRWLEGLGRRVDYASFGRWHWVLLLALLGLAWPLVAERGLIVQADYPGWASIVKMFEREVLPECHWFWAVPFPRLNAGEILGQPYSLSLIVPWLLTRIMSPEWALKLLVLAAYLTLGFGFYCFAAPKSSRFAACLGGYLCVLDSLWYTNFGMWYDSLSVGLAFFFFVALERFAATGRTRTWMAAVLLLALTILAHPLGTIMALAGWFGFLVWQLLRCGRADPARVVLVLCLPALALGMAWPQVMGTVVGGLTGGGEDPSFRYSPFRTFGSCWSRSILLVSLYGLAGALRGRRPLLWMILPPLLLAFVLYRNWIAALPCAFPFKAGLTGFATRFMLMASTATLVLFALGVARVQGALWAGQGAGHSLRRWVLCLIVLGVGLLGGDRTLVYQPKTLVGESGLPDHKDFMALCDWMDKNIDHRAERVYVEDTFGRVRDFRVYPANRAGRYLLRTLRRDATEYTHYMSLLSLRTGCQQVNGFPTYQNPFNRLYCVDGELFAGPRDGPTPRMIREQLWALNCRHIVSLSDSLREFLATMRFLRCSCRFGRFCVFTWSDMPPHYAWSEGPSPQPIPTTRASAVRYEVDLRGSQAATVYLSVQYHANWKAYLDGTPVQVMPWRGLVSVLVPPGTDGTLLVCYELRRAGPLGVASASTLALCAVALARYLHGAGKLWSGSGRAPGGGTRAARLCGTAIS